MDSLIDSVHKERYGIANGVFGKLILDGGRIPNSVNDPIHSSCILNY